MTGLAVTVYCNDHRVDLDNVWVDPWTQIAPTGDYHLLELEIRDVDIPLVNSKLDLARNFQGALVLIVIDAISPHLLPAIMQWQEGMRLTLTLSDDVAISAIQRLRSAQI